MSGNNEYNISTGNVFIGNGVDPSPAEARLLWKRRKKRIVPVPSASEEDFLNYHKITSKKKKHHRRQHSYSSDAMKQKSDENFVEIDNKNTAILAQIELVLLHAKGESPKNTRRFYANRPGLRRHHHCRLSSYSDADVDRIARHIAGCGVGVVLAGGGGHGLAHLGALKALEDEGVPSRCHRWRVARHVNCCTLRSNGKFNRRERASSKTCIFDCLSSTTSNRFNASVPLHLNRRNYRQIHQKYVRRKD